MIVRVNTPRFKENVGDQMVVCGAVTVRFGWVEPPGLSAAPYITDGLRLSEPHPPPFGIFRL